MFTRLSVHVLSMEISAIGSRYFFFFSPFLHLSVMDTFLSCVLGKTLGQKSTVAPSLLEIKNISLEKAFFFLKHINNCFTKHSLVFQVEIRQASSQCTASWPWVLVLKQMCLQPWRAMEGKRDGCAFIPTLDPTSYFT